MPNEIADKAARIDALAVVAPLILASFEESSRITTQLEEANVKSCFLDGFEAGLIEGELRAEASIRESLGIRQKEPPSLNGEFYFKQMSGYPYAPEVK